MVWIKQKNYIEKNTILRSGIQIDHTKEGNDKDLQLQLCLLNLSRMWISFLLPIKLNLRQKHLSKVQTYKQSMTITHTGNVFSIAVAEMALGLFLTSYRRISDHNQALHSNAGEEAEDISLNREAYGKTAGIIGLGNQK
jgi:hypothetical protein